MQEAGNIGLPQFARMTFAVKEDIAPATIFVRGHRAGVVTSLQSKLAQLVQEARLLR